MDDHYDNEFIFEPNPLKDIEAMPLPSDHLFFMVLTGWGCRKMT